MSAPFVNTLIDRASAPYLAAGRFAWYFARGKLRGDPVFAGLLEHGLIPGNSHLLDIGCGQGLLASWLLAANAMQNDGLWPSHWPSPPKPRSIRGIDIMAGDVERAQSALGHAATFTTGDMCKTGFGKADVIVILDVLHYVNMAAQNDVLLRARNALTPGGTLILRVGDASGGLPFKFGVCVDYVASFVRGHRNVRLHCRTLPDWCAALADLGFNIRKLPMNKGTPFANVLLVANLVQNTNLQPREGSTI